jgi:hypothetical protein
LPQIGTFSAKKRSSWGKIPIFAFFTKFQPNFIVMKQLFHRGLLLTAFIFGLFFRMTAQSTQIVVSLNDGTEQNFNLTEADRLYFEDNTKLVIEEIATKNTVTIPLADIRKITCPETVGTTENPDLALGIFPNPVHDVMTFRNLQGKQTVSLYALDGRLIKTFEATGNQVIDISDLPFGLYLVKTQTQTLKMIKL